MPVEVVLSNLLYIRGLDKVHEDWLYNESQFSTLSFASKDIPPNLNLFQRAGNFVAVPRGMAEKVKSYLNFYNIAYTFKYDTAKGEPYKFQIQASVNYTTGDYFYQDPLVTKLLKFDTARLKAPAGSGKTACACIAAAKLGKAPILFLTNRDRLIRQFVDTVTRVLGIPKKEVGVIKANKFSIRPITVGSLATLGKEGFDLESLKKTFYAVFFDECHISSALTYRRVILNLAPRHLFGLSATPDHYSSENLTDLICSLLGRIEVSVKAEDIPGRLNPTTVQLNTGLSFEYKAKSDARASIRRRCLHKMHRLITASKDRNLIIANIAKKLLSQNHKVIITVARIEHGKTLYQGLTRLGMKCSFPYKTNKKGEYQVDHKTLDLEVEKILDGESDILIGTASLFQVGFDCPPLSALIVAAPFYGGNTTALEQVVGRIQRNYFGKDCCIVFDLCDTSYPNNILGDWASARVSEYKKRFNDHHIYDWKH